MKSIFFAVTVAALVGAVVASCPNACSGHGSCGNHDRCTCYANFVGGDCSEKACPYGLSGQECSGRGTCDRGSGSCECADGYSGASCQRISCPNDCSGKGSCDTSTGMCSCAGGYAGNDCSTRLCPKGDDPLTHEVENSGDGSASQQSEVQTVSFNAGRGLGGTATLTYSDLYGQSWTTRPFHVGGDNVYRLEMSIVPGTTCGSNKCDVAFTYNGNTATVVAHADADYALSSKTITAEAIRTQVIKLFGAYQTDKYVGKDRGNTLYVREHYSATSVKLGGSIHANTRVTFDINIPIDMSGHDDNGELMSAFTVAWGATPTANTQELKLYQLGDRSAEIESALTSLPNQVIPSVAVNKVSRTDAGTLSDGANGNAYAQSYAITFNNEANAGDQHMLACNAAPCDEDGCINRGTGVSEVRYMHHDAENHGEGINFVNQGYFIMDIGSNAVLAGLGAGSIKIMWDTGAGIDSAIFAIVATAAEVQTALRTITGWEAVTVELWASRADSDASNGDESLKVLKNHQFKVTFAAGYDDLGKSPTFYTMLNTDGAYATAVPSTARARLYDQRFSNSIWLGKLTGYAECKQADNTVSCNLQHTALDGTVTSVVANAENGDKWVTSDIFFGTGGLTGGDATDPGSTNSEQNDITLQIDTNPMSNDIGITGGNIGTVGAASPGELINYAYLKEGKTSVQTSDYFAVGSTIEVMGTTWDKDLDASLLKDVDVGALSNNKYRTFKVTGHVTNEFNREFAKLDSFPADDNIGPATANAAKPDYLLKITSNNGTTHSYETLAARINVNEVQIITLGEGQDDDNSGQVWKLYYKGEESQNMDASSTPAQVAEEINGFSQLSGPVTVTADGSTTANTPGHPRYRVTFDAKDGDVAEMTVVADSGTVAVVTRAHGWSIEGPVGLGMDTMQAGGIVNITAKEVCTFAAGASVTAGQFCYNNICGPKSVDGTDTELEDAVQGIKDDNGVAVLLTATVALSTNDIVVTMPLAQGMSCDGLEMRNTNTAVTKSVDRNNNGKSFKITRSFLTSTAIASVTDATNVACAAGKCHEAVQAVDSIIIGGASCDTKAASDVSYPLHRDAGAVTISATASATSIAIATLGTGVSGTACEIMYLGRHVITLDSMPTASATSVDKTLLYSSPTGSCSVAETTKGTYESFECSNRGACDGGSGLCSCYSGYSGQSCQTQTVLV